MDIWKHGKYIDMWSLVHFLSGFLLAGLFFKLDHGFVQALFFSMLLLVAWEIFEWAVKIIEPSINVAMDLVIGLVGFLCGSFVYYLLQESFGLLFYMVLGVTAVLAFWGFFDFLKRGYR